MRTLIIVPAYNEEGSIKRVIDNLKDNYPQYDYIIVNDGSTDATSQISHDNGFNIIDLPVNLGLSGAFQTGIKYAYKHGHDLAVQFDGDGQHRPEYISKMMEKAAEGYNIVIASRFLEKNKAHSARAFGGKMISLAIKLTTGVKITDPTSGMRLFDRSIIEKCAVNNDYGPEPDTVSYMIRKGAKVAEVQAVMDERTTGESYLNLSASFKYMVRMMMSILFIQAFR